MSDASVQPQLQLIKCATCHESIAALAVSCPKCGAPNTWQHPGVEHFLQVKDRLATPMRFNYTTDKTTIAGQTEPKTTAAGWFFGVLFFVGGTGLSMFLGMVPAVVGGFLGALALIKMRTYEWFRADMAKREWSSSDERIWQPVRRTLQL